MPKLKKSNSTARQGRLVSHDKKQPEPNQSIKDFVGNIDSVESLYKALDSQEQIKDTALLMLTLRSWLTEASSFDPVSGDALNTSIVNFMNAAARPMQGKVLQSVFKDRIFRIVEHTNQEILAIMRDSRDKILREHAMVPIYAAKEIDSKSIQWLSRQPGRTLREKLSGKPYTKAVKRRSSVDTSENRLFKAYVIRLEQTLSKRPSILFTSAEEPCEDLLVSLQRWLRSEDALEIGAWGNLPPNNTLLQDKRYRKIWDGWLWLQGMDELIIRDSARIHHDILGFIYWSTLSLLNLTGRFRTIQQPVELDYDDFSISSELSIQGYLFPVKGTIRNINYEKEYGFLTSESGVVLFFDKSNLSGGLDIDSLRARNEVYFVIGSNKRGDCAEGVALTAGLISVEFSLSSDVCDIQIGEKKLSLQIECDHLVVDQTQDIKKKLELKPEILEDIPQMLLSLVANTTFEYLEPEDCQSDLTKMNSSVIDLCSIRPAFTNHSGIQGLLPFRLVQQTWNLEKGSTYILDCGEAKAIALDPCIRQTVSMRSLFLDNSTLSVAEKSSASMFFMKRLSHYINARKLTYLIPDWVNDFDLDGIRKSINFYFEGSTPLPKSIAAIFAWQSSKAFTSHSLKEKDLVLVIDNFGNSISVTPVEANYQKELSAILPETKGISWERHPTITLDHSYINESLIKCLSKAGCQVSEEIVQLFGFDGLVKDAGAVSFVKDDNWYHLPSSIRETLIRSGNTKTLSNYDIGKCLSSTNRDCSGANIFIMPLEETIKKSDSLKNYKWLGSNWSLAEGGQILNDWQNSADGIALWRDHLPDLSIRILRDGLFENFYLVKNATVTPELRRVVDIPVEESFTLPAGQTHYSFPLQQGEGNKELQFVAYLKSPAFPLKESTVCTLKMIYSYGADNPYELKFIPLDSEKAGFKSILVDWQPASESEASDLENLPTPDFPQRNNWSDFKKFPKEDGTSFSDLLDWVDRDLEKISDIENYGRISGVIPKWVDKGKGNVFCFINGVFIHKSSLRLEEDEDLPEPGETLCFYKIKGNKGKFIAEDVLVSGEHSKYCFLSKSLRFPTLTIWNQEHSLSEPDVPEHFRDTIFKGVPKALSILKSSEIPESLKEELFFFLSCLHRDAPEIVATRLLDASKDTKLLDKYRRNIAFAIGSAELKWQQELFENVINSIDSKGATNYMPIGVLSIALWRSKGLISKLSDEDVGILNKSLHDYLQQVVNGGKSRQMGQIERLGPHLELLLALLRTREDMTFKMALTPEKELSKNFVTLIDNVSKIVIERQIGLKSRINLQIDKPEEFNKTPDLLYALRMYLTGNSGANTISITSVRDEA